MNRAEAAAIGRAAKAAKAPSLRDRFWSKVEILGEDECWPWKASPRSKKQGYGAFWMDGRHTQPTEWRSFCLAGRFLTVCRFATSATTRPAATPSITSWAPTKRTPPTRCGRAAKRRGQ